MRRCEMSGDKRTTNYHNHNERDHNVLPCTFSEDCINAGLVYI